VAAAKRSPRPLPQPGAQATATRPAAAQPTTPAGGANELASLAENFGKAKSFRAKIVVESPGQAKQEGTMAAVLPDRYQFSLGGIEVIGIGSDGYV
jgi:hypothetical protein